MHWHILLYRLLFQRLLLLLYFLKTQKNIFFLRDEDHLSWKIIFMTRFFSQCFRNIVSCFGVNNAFYSSWVRFVCFLYSSISENTAITMQNEAFLWKLNRERSQLETIMSMSKSLLKIFVAIENQWFKDFLSKKKKLDERIINTQTKQPNSSGDKKILLYEASNWFPDHSRVIFKVAIDEKVIFVKKISF
jgi:hypothetical protein